MKTKEIQWLLNNQEKARELLKLDKLAQLIKRKLHLKDAEISIDLKAEVKKDNPMVKTNNECYLEINCKTNLVNQFGIAKWSILDIRLFTEINQIYYESEFQCYLGFIFLDFLIAAVGGYSHALSVGICYFDGETWDLKYFKKADKDVLLGANEGFSRDPSAKRITSRLTAGEGS